MFNDGAEINTINQLYTVELELPELVGADLPKPQFLFNASIYIYAVYKVALKLCDS